MGQKNLINCVREGRFYEEVLSLLENLWRYHQTLSIANLLYEADNDAREYHRALSIENPIDLASDQEAEPNEIKKSTKTPEERRKEIEVRVDAARLLQQKSESSSSDNVNNKGSDSTLGSGQRSGERRKHGNARKNGSSQEQRNEGKICLESRFIRTGCVQCGKEKDASGTVRMVRQVRMHVRLWVLHDPT
ncbi:hypothetical protein F2Q68_00031090 [Brassica cretica]|uniref:Uncharacterized protein n=1 Tax=Brassica cretica TaxID=69181 RepID=A0A8S9GCZ5_BRACR|nr:hypothetical protein F2Q68_00031090 [Brassica cretica]